MLIIEGFVVKKFNLYFKKLPKLFIKHQRSDLISTLFNVNELFITQQTHFESLLINIQY
jgi:hypothetical protein